MGVCFATVNEKQWWSVPFKMREDDRNKAMLIHFSITVIHMPFTQLNITLIGIGYYLILEFSLYQSRSCYNLAYE